MSKFQNVLIFGFTVHLVGSICLFYAARRINKIYPGGGFGFNLAGFCLAGNSALLAILFFVS